MKNEYAAHMFERLILPVATATINIAEETRIVAKLKPEHFAELTKNMIVVDLMLAHALKQGQTIHAVNVIESTLIACEKISDDSDLLACFGPIAFAYLRRRPHFKWHDDETITLVEPLGPLFKQLLESLITLDDEPAKFSPVNEHEHLVPIALVCDKFYDNNPSVKAFYDTV